MIIASHLTIVVILLVAMLIQILQVVWTRVLSTLGYAFTPVGGSIS